jgi:hypothetical protein
LLAQLSIEAGGEHARGIPRIVAVIGRHIADWQGGNASPSAHALIKLPTLIHYPRGRKKKRADKPRFFLALTFHCVRITEPKAR